jgi:hypothetical protein
VVRAAAADAVRATIADAMGKGARALIDGRKFPLDRPGSAYVAPQILIEPFIGVGDSLPWDYKLMVFNGRVEFIQVDTGRATAHRRTLRPWWSGNRSNSSIRSSVRIFRAPSA